MIRKTFKITGSINLELFGILFIFTELNCWNFFKEIFQILHIYIQFDFYASCASSASFPDQIILDWFEWIFCTVVISHSVLYCLKPSTCISIVLSVLYPLLINFPCTFSFSCFLISEIYVMVMVRFLNIVVMCFVCSNNSEKFKWSQSTSSIYVDSNLIRKMGRTIIFLTCYYLVNIYDNDCKIWMFNFWEFITNRNNW